MNNILKIIRKEGLRICLMAGGVATGISIGFGLWWLHYLLAR